MVRPIGFDENKIMQDAMLIFWRQGYELTSIKELEKATGLSRISIYNSFGDKQGLFIRALDLYHQNAVAAFTPISQGGLNGLVQLFERMAQPTTEQNPTRSGCMMVNTILGMANIAEPILEKVENYRPLFWS